MLHKEKFFRNMPTLSARQQAKVRSSRFCIIGLGGTGGFALECLVRLGAENLVLFDHDRFELSNFNRQILATDGTLDMRKTDAAICRASSINKKIKIKKYGAFDSGAKCVRALRGSDVVIDCTDSLATRLIIAKACRKLDIPCVFCSAEGSRGIVSVFIGYPMGKAFQIDKRKLASKSCASVLCPAAALAGSLAASQAINTVLGKPVARAPDALFFDIFDRRIFWEGRLG